MPRGCGRRGGTGPNPYPNPGPHPDPNPNPIPNPNPNPNLNPNQGASKPLSLTATGDATGLPLGTGRWGALNDPTLAQECPLYSCVFVDFGRGQRQLNGHVDEATGTLVLRPDAYGRRREKPWSCTKAA